MAIVVCQNAAFPPVGSITLTGPATVHTAAENTNGGGTANNIAEARALLNAARNANALRDMLKPRAPRSSNWSSASPTRRNFGHLGGKIYARDDRVASQ